MVVISSLGPCYVYKALKDRQSRRPKRKSLVYKKFTRNNVDFKIVVDYLKQKKKN